MDNTVYVSMMISLCTHKKLRPVHTMYAVKISGTQQFSVNAFSDTTPLKLSQNDSFSTSFVWLLCQQSRSSYNIK